MKPTRSFVERKIEKVNTKVAAKERKSRRPTLRPNAAVNEKVRLKALNDALKKLQDVIPVKLPEGRKLHKKQTLQLASRYIHFLRGCLDGSRDWSDRNRFWCESDEHYSIIDAIDAAAAAGKKNPKEERKKVKTGEHSVSAREAVMKTGEHSVSVSEAITSALSAQTQQSDPHFYNYDHWMVHHPELCPSHPPFHSFMNFQLPLFSAVSAIQNNNFIFFDNGSRGVTDLTPAYLHQQEPADRTVTLNVDVTQANEELVNSASSVTNSSSATPSYYLQTSNDHLEDIWTDLNEIISHS